MRLRPGSGLALALGAAAVMGGILLGGEAWTRAQAGRTGRRAYFRVETVQDDVQLRAARSPRLPKGSALLLKAGQGESWVAVVERRGGDKRVLRRVRRLRPPAAGLALLGAGAEAPIAFPRLARALRSLTVTATAYDPGPVDNTRGWVGTTATGARAHFGIAAVDPSVIPQGSLLYVEGYGPALAADRGGDIKGRRIDLCFNRTREALAWGRQRVRVWVLERAAKKDASAMESLLSRAAAPAS